MNKLKKVGLSALAGTLASLSVAQAGGVSVSGSWELSYTSLDADEVTGNALGMNKNITFGGSGELTDTVTWATTVAMSDSMGLSSASMVMNFGSIATLAYDSGTGGYGANAVDNVVPIAWEEIDYGFSTGITDVGAVSKSKGAINFSVAAPGSGTGLSITYVSRMGGGHVSDGGNSADTSGGRGWDARLDLVNVNMSQFGFRLGSAVETEIIEGPTCQNRKNPASHDSDNPGGDTHTCAAKYHKNPWAGTAYSTLRLGPLSFGLQATYKDPELTAQSAVANNSSIVGGAALTIGDYISVGWGKGQDEYTYNDAARVAMGGENVVSHFTGWSATANWGPVALKGVRNQVDNQNGAHGGDQHTEINLSIAF